MSHRVEKDVRVPMRDGQALATDLCIPDGDPAPALLVRTPYGKDVPNLLVLASGMQQGGSTDLSDVDWTRRRWNGMQAYSDSKLFDATLAAALARRWPEVLTTSVSPGWVATKMGGAGAPDDLDAASATQAWLAGSGDDAKVVSGAMYYHGKAVRSPGGAGARSLHPAVGSEAFQDELLATLAGLTETELPGQSSVALPSHELPGVLPRRRR